MSLVEGLALGSSGNRWVVSWSGKCRSVAARRSATSSLAHLSCCAWVAWVMGYPYFRNDHLLRPRNHLHYRQNIPILCHYISRKRLVRSRTCAYHLRCRPRMANPSFRHRQQVLGNLPRDVHKRRVNVCYCFDFSCHGFVPLFASTSNICAATHLVKN
jgi:hypothetical protein